MPSWKKKSRALEKAKMQIMINGDNPQNKKSRWALKRMDRDQIHWSHMWGSKLWRDERRRRNRKRQREITEAMRDFEKYPYIEDCRYHPCKVTKITVEQGMTGYDSLDFECESLVNGSPNACSYFHCGTVHLDEKEAQERVAMINKLGMFPYQLKEIYQVKDASDAENILAELITMESHWKFNENGPEVMTEDGKIWLKEKYSVDYEDIKANIDREKK